MLLLPLLFFCIREAHYDLFSFCLHLCLWTTPTAGSAFFILPDIEWPIKATGNLNSEHTQKAFIQERAVPSWLSLLCFDPVSETFPNVWRRHLFPSPWFVPRFSTALTSIALWDYPSLCSSVLNTEELNRSKACLQFLKPVKGGKAPPGPCKPYLVPCYSLRLSGPLWFSFPTRVMVCKRFLQ